MKSEPTLKRARSLAYKMLAARSRTVAQLREGLKRKGMTEELVDLVVAELEADDYLNDRRFAENWIEWRLESRPCGPLYLLSRLVNAGIPLPMAREVLESSYPYERQAGEACRLVRQLAERGEACPQKLLRKLINRGFTASAARRAVEEEFTAHLDITP
jgi:regulatory protein